MSEFVVVQRPDGHIDVVKHSGQPQPVAQPWVRWNLIRVDNPMRALEWALKRWQS